MKITALPYYITSLATLLTQTNFWNFSSILINQQTVVKLPNSLQFYVSNPMDIWTLKELILDQVYTKKHPIKKGDTVIDIGGSIGDFATYAEKTFQAKKVISYELNLERISLFKKNVQLNQLRHVTLHEKPALSLDEVFRENTLSFCDFFKIDCEGGEYHIFDHASSKTLKNIQYIAMEIHRFDDIMKKAYPVFIDRLKKHGFTVEIIDNPVHNTIQYLYAKNTSYHPPKKRS